MKLIVLFLLVINALDCNASEGLSRKQFDIKSSNSVCQVKCESDGSYLTYKVYKKNKIIYEPKSDQIDGALFSNDGNYIVFGGTDIPSVDVGNEYFLFSIVNCNSEKIKGFINGKTLKMNENNMEFTDKIYKIPSDWMESFIPFEWIKNNEGIKFKYCGKKCTSPDKVMTFIFDKRDPLP